MSGRLNLSDMYDIIQELYTLTKTNVAKIQKTVILFVQIEDYFENVHLFNFIIGYYYQLYFYNIGHILRGW